MTIHNVIKRKKNIIYVAHEYNKKIYIFHNFLNIINKISLRINIMNIMNVTKYIQELIL